MSESVYHVPVLAGDVARLAAGRRRAVDGTTGGGGHTAILLEAGARVLAIDRDPNAIAAAQARLPAGDVTWVTGAFADERVLNRVRRFRPDFVLLDLGVSSHQLDADARGFSFRRDVPLDMRMSATGRSAADLLNTGTLAELADLFHRFGDERRARRLAETVVRRRADARFATSDDLVNAIRRALGPRTGPGDFARLFQAVRMAVNHEIPQLERALPGFRDALVAEGILVVITYHSGEDRLVKHQFAEWVRRCVCPPKSPLCTCRARALGRLPFRKPLVAADSEVGANPRARSAKLRAFVRDDGS
ncbi:MAG TPA: 16S rRNA (cytosine(1402)-N(4))-methyltransferase RsmH [Gemmatimonadales bacterium]